VEEGDLFVVGAPKIDRAYGYFFNPSDSSSWTPIAELEGPAGTYFGFSVACYDDVIVVGAPGANENKGSVYTYLKNSDGGFTLMEAVRIIRLYSDLYIIFYFI
jgi:hypothetical protein